MANKGKASPNGRERARSSTGPIDRPSRPKSPRQTLRQAPASDQVDSGSLERASSTDLVDRSGSKRAPKSDLGRCWGDFGSPRGSISVFFRCFSARAFRLARRRRDIRKTYRNHVFLQVFRMSALARTTRNSIENRYERASRWSRATDRVRKALCSSF